MSTGRSQKRARKKERRHARRAEVTRYVRRRRRQRLLILLGSLASLAAIALAVLYVVRTPSEPAATPAASGEQTSVKVPTQEPVACDAELPRAAGSTKEQYSRPTDQKLDPSVTYKLILNTSCGDVEIALDVERAPKTSNSIVFLARKAFYDGTFFHRIAPDFVAQGGDPTGTGSGGSGYKVVEAPPDDLSYDLGIVAMAKGGTEAAGTSGSQFFIVGGKQGENLPPDYALLGKVTKGMDVVEEIMRTGVADGVPPRAYTYVERAVIVEA